MYITMDMNHRDKDDTEPEEVLFIGIISDYIVKHVTKSPFRTWILRGEACEDLCAAEELSGLALGLKMGQIVRWYWGWNAMGNRR